MPEPARHSPSSATDDLPVTGELFFTKKDSAQQRIASSDLWQFAVTLPSLSWGVPSKSLAGMECRFYCGRLSNSNYLKDQMKKGSEDTALKEILK